MENQLQMNWYFSVYILNFLSLIFFVKINSMYFLAACDWSD